MKKIISFYFLTLLVSSAANAGEYIALNAVITKVGNTAGNGDSFWVVAKNGTGSCVTTGIQNNIYFPRQSAGNEKIFDRAYSTALTALASGKKVNIHNYVDGSCNTAAAIEIMAE